MEAEDLLRSESFDLVHELGEGEESEEDEKIPGPEMLFKVPSRCCIEPTPRAQSDAPHSEPTQGPATDAGDTDGQTRPDATSAYEGGKEER